LLVGLQAVNRHGSEEPCQRGKYKELTKYIAVIGENDELRKRIYTYMENDHLHSFMEFLQEQDPKFDPTPFLIEYRKWFEEKKKKEDQ